MTTKYPPKLSFSEAIRVIKEIYNIHKSDEISLDLMPEIVKAKRNSSNFPDKIVALQRFGLVDKKPNEILKLTNLALQIVNPIGNEDIEAKLNAIKNDELLSTLIEKYPNKTLPSPEQTKQTLIKSFNVPRETVDKWYQYVIDSFREISIKKTDLRISGSADIEFKPSPATITVTQNIILPSGKKFTFALEDGLTQDDLEFITDFFELKKKRLGKGN